MTKNPRFQFRKKPKIIRMVKDLMTARRFATYTELFYTLVREAWERLQARKKR